MVDQLPFKCSGEEVGEGEVVGVCVCVRERGGVHIEDKVI